MGIELRYTAEGYSGRLLAYGPRLYAYTSFSHTQLQNVSAVCVLIILK
jgi:hypothetical protein